MTTRTKSGANDVSRLDANAWTQAALETLAISGVEGVRVEQLAKRLAVTKGSFYWHFKDRDALYESMLDHWRRRATLSLIERLDKAGAAPRERLRQLLRVPIMGRGAAEAADVELAIRLWGRTDARARKALEEVDQLRLRYIASLLVECGIDSENAEARAILAYSYMRVAATLISSADHDLMARCEALILDAAPAQSATADKVARPARRKSAKAQA